MSLGGLLQALGEYEAARPCIERALAVREKTLGPAHPATAVAVHDLGLLLQDQGDTAAARLHLERALTLKLTALGPDHPSRATTLVQLGLLCASAGDDRAAWQHLTAGNDLLVRAADSLLSASAERDHATIVRKWRLDFEVLFSLAEAAPEPARANGRALLRSVFDWKANSGRSLSARREALALGADLEAARLYAQLQPVRQQLIQATLRGPNPARPGDHQALLQSLAARRDRLERELARRVEGYAALRRATQAGPDEVFARLSARDVLVELVRYDRYDVRAKTGRPWGPSCLAAILVSRSASAAEGPAIRLVFLGEATPIEDAVRTWRRAVQDNTLDEAAERAVRQRVWEPLARELPEGARRLLIAPDGELSLLPFEAIRQANGRFLVEDWSISYLTSGRDLMPRPLPQVERGPALVLADPDYDAGGADREPAPAAGPAPGVSLRSRELAIRFFHCERLPGFAREADAVLQAWKATRPAEVPARLQGRDASEDRLADSKRPRLLYLITHGFFLPDLKLLAADRDRLLRGLEVASSETNFLNRPAAGEDPRLRSGLALAGANRWRERSERGQSDGLLTAAEVEQLDLVGTELVVLSACETGLGQVQVGEGVLGLRRAFQNAGARTVLASLWKVPDDETERLMTKIFRRYLAGVPPDQALRAAQRELLAEFRAEAASPRRSGSPLYWAGFICHGRPE